LRALLLGLIGGLALAPAALAQSVPNTSTNSSINLDLGTVLATGTATNNGDASIPGTAANEAPTHGSLKETQPTSVISQKFVQATMPPTVNYSDIINISPSSSSTNQSGPGLDESKHVQMRGFQDGQYNVTFDGIPYGDSNDFTHHTTSFFMENDIGETIVDRGPGTASTVGNATFGGTVAIVSKDPLPTRTVTGYGTYGSWDTYVGGVEADTGAMGPYGTTAFVDGEHAASNTYNQNANITRSNVFAKMVQPLGNNFVLTAVAMYNKTYQQFASGGTLAQIAAYGPTFGLSTNPLSQNYNKYNTDHYTTDFEYLDLRGVVGDGWTIDSKVYTYAYYHHSLNGDDPLDCGNGACLSLNIQYVQNLPGGSKEGTTSTNPNGGLVVPGQFSNNTYRSVGTISRVEKDFDAYGVNGDLKFGVWYDHQQNSRYLVDQNLAIGNSESGTNLAPGTGTAPYERLMHDTLDTFQPYVQLDLKPIDGLTISPGVKWDYFKRGIKAPINQKTYQPLYYTGVYKQPVPSITANYQITSDMSVYAQYAEGFLAPNLNVLYSTNPALSSSLNPQTTQNYQAGVVYQSADFAGDADAYYIPFSNMVSSTTIGGVKEFFNAGGAIYKGVEAEGTYVLGHGFNFYANGSINSANYDGTKGKNHVAETPDATWAVGLIYDDGMYNGSITDKWVGRKYGVDSNATAATVSPTNPYNLYGFDPYNIVNVSAGVDLKHGANGAPPIKVTLNVDNLTDQTQVFDYAGTTGSGVEAVYTLPGRSVFVNVSVPIGF
jgi:iron complex outermembrane receptor protein